MRRFRSVSKRTAVTGKSPADMVAEALMTELKYQLNIAHQLHLQKLDTERRQDIGVDYSWLATSDSPVRRPYELPEMKRIELEQMCERVSPSDCGRVLLTFRQLIADQTALKADEIPQLFRATISQVLSQQPATKSARQDVQALQQRFTQSLSNIRLRPGSRVAVAPFMFDDNVSSATAPASSITTCFTTSSITSNILVTLDTSSTSSCEAMSSECHRSQSTDILTTDND